MELIRRIISIIRSSISEHLVNSNNRISIEKAFKILHAVKSQPAQEKLGGYVKPRHPVNIGAFNVRTLMQIGQQASLAMTLAST